MVAGLFLVLSGLLITAYMPGKCMWGDAMPATNVKTGRFESMWTPTLTERARKLYVDRGLSLREVASRLDCSLGAAQNVVNLNGWMRKKQAKSSRLRNHPNRVTRLYLEQEWSCERIADLYGVEATVVREFVAELGILRTKQDVAKLRAQRGDNNWMRKHADNWRKFQKVDAVNLTYAEYDWYVRRLTAAVLHRYSHILDPDNKRGTRFHIDHRYSLFSGYMRWSEKYGMFVPRAKPMALTTICHPANLRLIDGKQNSIKGIYCAHDEVNLVAAIAEFERKHGKVFNG